MYATASANSDVVRNRSFASHSRSHSAEPLDVEGGRGAREKTQRNEFSAHPNGIHNRVQRAIQRDAKALTNAAIVAAVVAAKTAIPNGKSASYKSDGSPKPLRAAKR